MKISVQASAEAKWMHSKHSHYTDTFVSDENSDSFKNHSVLLSEQKKALTLDDRERSEGTSAIRSAPFPEQMEKPNTAEMERTGNNDIGDNNKDVAENVSSDERPHENDNFKNKDVRMGERLTDDIIDAYCDKLQESINREVDGMLAMQYILLEPDSIHSLIKGDKNVCQVIYDHYRAHYLVLFRNKLNPKRIIVYDPIVPHKESVRDTLNESVREQILAMFGHLYRDDEVIEIAVETGLSTQNDCWSCGLRAVAFVTHLLLGIDPAKQRKDGKSCLTIVRVTKNGEFLKEKEDGSFVVLPEDKKRSLESIGDDKEDEVKALESGEERVPPSIPLRGSALSGDSSAKGPTSWAEETNETCSTAC